MHSRPRPESFHPDLRLARWMPQFGATARTFRIMRGSPSGVRSTPRVTVGSVPMRAADGSSLTYRVFRPAQATGPVPVLFWIHGGGFVIGSPQQDDGANLTLATDLGIVVIAAAYRLAPEHPAPAALDDLVAGYREVMSSAEEFGIDPSRVAIGGASAGAGLAAALVNRLHDEGDPDPLFQLLLYPMLDDRTVLRTDVDTRGLRMWMPKNNRFGWTSYLGAEPGGAGIPAAHAPARREDLSGLPPTWIGVGTLDLFHDEDLAYAQRLRDAGVSCETYVIPGAFHGFDAVFRKADVTRAMHEEWIRMLRPALRLEGEAISAAE